MPVYTRSDLRNEIWDSKMYSNISNRIDTNTIMNRIVRDVLSEIDLRSSERKSSVTPNLFDNINDYNCPTDMKGYGFIDLEPQTDRSKNADWTFTDQVEFSLYKATKTGLVAIKDNDLIRKLLVSVDNDLDQLVISSLDSLTGDGGTWEAFDSDTANVVVDTDNYVKGSGSIRFDINAAGGTTAGIKNTSLDTFDYDDYVTQNRSVFVFAWITSTTNITNYKLRVGETTGAYDEITVTTQSDGTAFRVGWNLLRFDFSAKNTTGTPDRTAGTYAAIFMTKDAAKVSETSYRFDHIIAQEGKYYELYYYSKYGWQNSGGTYLENSTDDTDYINCDTDEWGLIIQKGKIEKANLDKDYNLVDREEKRYTKMKGEYVLKNPSKAQLINTTYQEV